MIDPKELEELKATMQPSGCKDCADYNGTCPNDGMPCDSFFRLRTKLETFIKKHEPKPPWPPEKDQQIYYLPSPGELAGEEYVKDDPFMGVAIEYGVAFPSIKMAEFVRDFLASKAPEYWEKEMEEANDKTTV